MPSITQTKKSFFIFSPQTGLQYTMGFIKVRGSYVHLTITFLKSLFTLFTETVIASCIHVLTPLYILVNIHSILGNSWKVQY